MKMFLDLHKKVPLVPLYINTTVQPTEFLMDWLPESAMALVPGGRDRVATCERERQVRKLAGGCQPRQKANTHL